MAAASARGFPSDTSILVDVCLDVVRDALDAGSVLPPPPLPIRTSPRRVAVFRQSEIVAAAPPASGVVATSASARPVLARPRERAARPERPARPDPKRSAKTVATPRPAPRAASRAGWPLFLCAAVAFGAAGVAFLRSPLAASPDVQSVLDHGRADVLAATALVASALGR